MNDINDAVVSVVFSILQFSIMLATSNSDFGPRANDRCLESSARTRVYDILRLTAAEPAVRKKRQGHCIPGAQMVNWINQRAILETELDLGSSAAEEEICRRRHGEEDFVCTALSVRHSRKFAAENGCLPSQCKR